MSYRILFTILLLAAFIYACGEKAAPEASKSTAEAPTEVKQPNGKKIYKQYCVTCHGLYGNMGASGAFNLQESELALEERVAVITNGRNTMTAFSSLLSEEKIQAVAEYTMELTQSAE